MTEADGSIIIDTQINTDGFDKGLKEMKKKTDENEKGIASKLGDLLEKMSNKMANGISKAADKMGEFGKKGAKAIGQILTKVVSFGASIGGIILALGLLGAAAAGIFILGKALDQANGKSGQLKANLSYIGFVASKMLENALAPAINKTTGAVNGLVGALYKAVVYIGYIISQFFGIKNIFAGTDFKSYEQSMKEAQKSAKKTAKATKQIKKDLMGFDEVNKLSDNTSSSSGAGTSADKITMPNLPSVEEILKNKPKWIDDLVKHKDDILRICDALIALFVFKKTIEWLMPLTKFFGMLSGGGVSGGLAGLTNGLSGVLLQLGAIAVLCQSVYTWQEGNKQQRAQLNRMAERGVELAEEDVKENKTLAETTEFLNYKRKQGNELLKKSHSAGAKLTGTTKEILNNAKAVAKEDKLYIDQQMEKFRKGELTKEQQEQLIDLIKGEKSYVGDVYDELEKKKMSTKEIGELEHKYGEYLKEINPQYQTGNAWMDKIFNKQKEINENAKNTKDNVEKTANNTKTWWERIKDVKDKLKSIVDQKMPDKSMKVKVDADTKNVTSSFSNFISGIGSKISNAFKKADLSGFKDNIASVFSKLMPNLSLANIKKKLGLRQGGIINVPGRGVSLNSNVIGGEAGPEAVVPLDDTTMDRLGSAIARHMNINLTNVTQMNGRTISRELKTIMNENEFTYNG